MAVEKHRVEKHTGVTAKARCEVCHEGGWGWWSKNAQAVAFRHTAATGHKTYVESMVLVIYKSTTAEGD